MAKFLVCWPRFPGRALRDLGLMEEAGRPPELVPAQGRETVTMID